jgi:hypothetical protein
MANYYKLEWGQGSAPSDPNAQPGRRDGWPATPQTAPPMPFTEWPYGGTQNLGVTRPAAVDSPLMVGIANTWLGKAMAEANIQLYGWIDPGGNLSTSRAALGGNSPAAYDYNPNALQLDQFVLYFERVPDTVQKDHIDWGFRLSAIYGSNYRYTTAYGVDSYQLLAHNNVNGYDFPMVWVEAFIPWVGAGGTDVRLGRYISLPDIEAQLAPNNYMYSHSITYTLDNYTNSGLQFTTGVTKNFFLQYGISVGTEAAPWHFGQGIDNPTQTALLGCQVQEGSRLDAVLHWVLPLPDRLRQRQYQCLRGRHQHRQVGLQQLAVVWLYLLPQVYRQVACRLGGLHRERKRCAEQEQSDRRRHQQRLRHRRGHPLLLAAGDSVQQPQ